MNSNELFFLAWRDFEPSLPPSTPPPSLLQMELGLESLALACAPHLANSQTTFSTLHHKWYLSFQQNPAIVEPPPVPYTRLVIPASAPLRDTHAYSPPPRTNLPVGAPSRGIGKSLAPKPDVHDGTKEKYVQWWRTVQLYLARFDTEPTDRQKILIILSYMKGSNTAGRFTDLYLTQGLLASSTFDEFKAKLDKAFL